MSVLSSLASVLCRGRRVPRHGFAQITSKQGPKNFYKGKGCKPTGKHTSKGGYVLLDEKRPTYVVPDLSNFKARWKQSSCGRDILALG
ncbi:hypothetical protein H632_c1671p0 [Helicosporidium sp. ATCC 50920]|nr:hypothetical protein H632_c1671p0 [Helicosporidium sp. ATCC 50920]|eukprot:KDD73992.1 hypothetical protein H632_c1671p0 [Helicosporidium sp. ATCC 50920]